MPVLFYQQNSSNFIFYFISLAFCVAMLVALWKIYVKAGVEGISAIVPLWNTWNLFKITWGNGVYMFLMLIPLANIIISFITMVKLAKAFGKGIGFGLGLIFLAPIFIMILGFSDAEYYGVE